MTESTSDVQQYEYYEESLSSDTSAEDAPTVAWVDQQIFEAQASGYLYRLVEDIDLVDVAAPGDLQAVVERARAEAAQDAEQDAAQDAAGEAEPAPAAPLSTAEIREKIFARLRRPDGAPFAAGYTTGPAARLPIYQDEDTRSGVWRMGEARKDGDARTTIYADRATITDRAAGADEAGRVLDAAGEPIDGRWGWVIDDATGSLLLFDESANEWFDPAGEPYVQPAHETMSGLLGRGYRMRATHHTTPVAGMPVTGAGIIRLASGYIQELTDESGHYRPDGPQQHDALQALLDQGFSLEEATVRLTGNTMGYRPTDKAGWIDSAAGDNPDFPTGDVTLRPDQFLQTGGDEYQIRQKQALNEQINRLGDRPGTQTRTGVGTAGAGGGDESSYDDVSEDDPAPTGIEVDEDGRRWRMVADPVNPGYQFKEQVFDDVSESGSDTGSGSAGTYVYDHLSGATAERAAEGDAEGDTSAEEAPDPLQGARDYLVAAGRSAFAQWFRTLTAPQQDQLLADPQIAAAWRAENAPPVPAWQPAEAHQAGAATANAALVDSLDDRGSAVFILAGFSLLIGDGHDAQHQQYVADATDRVTGTVTVRKAGIGRGAGTLTFAGVPPAKQEVVREAVKRFSRKEVRFG